MLDLLPFRVNRKVTETVEEILRSPHTFKAEPGLRAAFFFLLHRPAELRRMVKDVWQIIIEDKDIPQEEYRAGLLRACDDALGMLAFFTERMDTDFGPEWPVSRSDLEKAVNGVRHVKSELMSDGPWFSPGAQVLSEHAREEYTDLEDAFSSVAGISKEEWSKRAQARRKEHESAS